MADSRLGKTKNAVAATTQLHFLFQEGEPRTWYVHFDLYSPVHSPGSAFRHLRHEFLGKVTPNWEMIAKHLNNG